MNEQELTRPITKITLSGEICSGTSTISRSLLTVLPNWTSFNTGEIARKTCDSMGISIQHVSELPKAIHKRFDDEQRLLLKERSHIILEGRLAGWVSRDIENVLRVRCYSPFDNRVRRYMAREDTNQLTAETEITRRDDLDLKLFKDLYGILDYTSPEYYDLQLDTSSASPHALAVIIKREIGRRASTNELKVKLKAVLQTLR